MPVPPEPTPPPQTGQHQPHHRGAGRGPASQLVAFMSSSPCAPRASSRRPGRLRAPRPAARCRNRCRNAFAAARPLAVHRRALRAGGLPSPCPRRPLPGLARHLVEPFHRVGPETIGEDALLEVTGRVGGELWTAAAMWSAALAANSPVSSSRCRLGVKLGAAGISTSPSAWIRPRRSSSSITVRGCTSTETSRASVSKVMPGPLRGRRARLAVAAAVALGRQPARIDLRGERHAAQVRRGASAGASLSARTSLRCTPTARRARNRSARCRCAPVLRAPPRRIPA